MKDNHILIIGGGAIGMPVAKQLVIDHAVTVVTRSPYMQKQTETTGELNLLTADICQPNTLESCLAHKPDVILVCVSPPTFSEAAYQQVYVTGIQSLLLALKNVSHNPKHLFFISSTSVYHQNDDSWVDEHAPTEPGSFSGKALLEAESELTRSSIPSTVIRFSGIYGGDRTRLIEQVLEGSHTTYLKEAYTNRIHEQDCIRLIVHLIRKCLIGEPLQPLYLASDCQPTRMGAVFDVIRHELIAGGIPLPEATQDGTKGKRRAGSKRCSNRAIRKTGFSFLYPTFKEGYTEMVRRYIEQRQ